MESMVNKVDQSNLFLHFSFFAFIHPNDFPLPLFQVSRVLQDLQAHLVQAHLRETEVTQGSQASLAHLAGKENQESQEGSEPLVVLVSRVNCLSTQKTHESTFQCHTKKAGTFVFLNRLFRRTR